VEHLSQDQLDAMVMGLAARDEESVRRHLAVCAECARRLTRAAQLESDLCDAAATATGDVAVARVRPAPARAWRVALPVAAALAVVAFGAWFQNRREGSGTVPPARWVAGAPVGDTLRLADSMSLGAGAYALPPQDVCRWVTVEGSQGPPY
jgi:hypothetical protein